MHLGVDADFTAVPFEKQGAAVARFASEGIDGRAHGGARDRKIIHLYETITRLNAGDGRLPVPLSDADHRVGSVRFETQRQTDQVHVVGIE